MSPNSDTPRLPWWPAVAALTLAGLALRIVAARGGGLWTDEAWSMIYAEQARDPLGVFLRINHDNNHHLISLWLQAIGVHASPLLARAPAIVAGTLAIPVAALLFARRSAVSAIAAAALFALSPIMVTYGSEARGYAPMMLAALVTIWLGIEAVEGRGTASTKWWIALAALAGMLSHLTMVAPVALVAMWVYLEKRSTVGSQGAFRGTLGLMGPALAACGATFLLVWLAARLSPTGMQLGGYVPFTFADYTLALSDLTAWTAGFVFHPGWLAVLALLAIGAALIARPPDWLGGRSTLYALLILGVPLAMLVTRTGNAHFARYYLCSAIGLLLLFADWIGQAVRAGGPRRALCGAACALFLVSGAWLNGETIALKRGEPERALRIIASEAPAGAQVAIGTPWLVGPMVAAAQREDYPLGVVRGCTPVRFMIASRVDLAKPRVIHCGRPMQAIAWSDTTPLSGLAWVLYRQGLQTAGPPVSGPALPGARNRRLLAERA